MDERCLHGNALNLVKPLGWVAFGLFAAATLLFTVHLKSKRKVSTTDTKPLSVNIYFVYSY